MNFERVAVLHIERLWRVLTCHSLSFEQKSHGLCVLALPLTECIHQLLEFSASLDLEEDFIVVICNLDVQVLGGRRRIASTVWRLLLVGHDAGIQRTEDSDSKRQ